MRIIQLLFMFLLPQLLFSQDVEWYKNTWKDIRGFEVSPNGLVTISGIYDHSEATVDGVTLNTVGSGMDFHDIFVARYTKDGEFMWARTSQIDDSGYQGHYGLAVDSENAAIITGSFSDNILFSGLPLIPNGGSSDIFVVKYNENGECIWSKNISGPGNDFARIVKTDKDNNIYVSASFNESITIDGQTFYTSSTQSEQIIIKLNPYGNLLWVSSQNDLPFSIFDVSPEGSVVLAGNSNNSFTVNGMTYSSSSWQDNMYVYKLNHNGSMDWFKYFDSENGQSFGQMQIDNKENIYLSFYAYDTLTLANETYFNPDSKKVLKLDSEGNLKWFSQFIGDTSECEGSYITLNHNDEVCFPCRETELIDSTNFINHIVYGWMYTSFNSENGQTTKHELHNLNNFLRLNFDKYGSVYATGYKWGGNQYDESDYDHLEIGSFFFKINGPIQDLGDDLVLYPNPSSGLFNLHLEGDGETAYTLKIYNVHGEIVLNTDVLDSNGLLIYTIDGSNWAGGVYTGTLESHLNNYRFRLIKN